MHRREFSKRLFHTAATVLFVDTLFGCSASSGRRVPETHDVTAPKVSLKLDQWALKLNEYCLDLKKKELTVVEWQERLDLLFGMIELDDLLRFIDFEKLISELELPDLGVATRTVNFPGIEGLPENTVFVKKLFGMKPGRSIIPHGHSNMASGHLILRGDMHLRQYDKLRLEDGAMLIRQTVDTEIGSGRFSSISDDRNNVHWFIAGNAPAFTFDVIMLDLNGKKYDIHNLDIDAAERQSGGDLRVPVMGVEKALSKYGKIHHDVDARRNDEQ